MATTFDISEPRLEELERVFALCQASQAAGLPDSAQGLAEACRGDRGLCIVARDGQHIAGVLVCTRTQRRLRLVCLTTTQGYENQGIEQRLLDKVMVKLSARGIHIFELPEPTDASPRMAWSSMKWQGQCDLQGQLPVGRVTACPLG